MMNQVAGHLNPVAATVADLFATQVSEPKEPFESFNTLYNKDAPGLDLKAEQLAGTMAKRLTPSILEAPIEDQSLSEKMVGLTGAAESTRESRKIYTIVDRMNQKVAAAMKAGHPEEARQIWTSYHKLIQRMQAQ